MPHILVIRRMKSLILSPKSIILYRMRTRTDSSLNLSISLTSEIFLQNYKFPVRRIQTNIGFEQELRSFKPSLRLLNIFWSIIQLTSVTDGNRLGLCAILLFRPTLLEPRTRGISSSSRPTWQIRSQRPPCAVSRELYGCTFQSLLLRAARRPNVFF